MRILIILALAAALLLAVAPSPSPPTPCLIIDTSFTQTAPMPDWRVYATRPAEALIAREPPYTVVTSRAPLSPTVPLVLPDATIGRLIAAPRTLLFVCAPGRAPDVYVPLLAR